MASTNFTNFPRALVSAGHNFTSDTLKVLLVSAAPSEANLDAWANRSDITGIEVTGTGYSAGGIAQPYTLNALDTALNRQTITLTNIVDGWTGATISAVGAIVYKNSGSSATDKLITFVDFGGTVAVTGGTFSITYSTDLIVSR